MHWIFKSPITLLALTVFLILAMYTAVGAQQSQEQLPASKVQVGTFDSRALAMAYSGRSHSVAN